MTSFAWAGAGGFRWRPISSREPTSSLMHLGYGSDSVGNRHRWVSRPGVAPSLRGHRRSNMTAPSLRSSKACRKAIRGCQESTAPLERSDGLWMRGGPALTVQITRLMRCVNSWRAAAAGVGPGAGGSRPGWGGQKPCDMDRQTLRSWVIRYNEQRIAGLSAARIAVVRHRSWCAGGGDPPPAPDLSPPVARTRNRPACCRCRAEAARSIRHSSRAASRAASGSR